MTYSNTPLVLVVCNDYGELAFAMYLLDHQPFAKNTTLMLPPRLHANNPDVLPGRTLAYHSIDDVRKTMDTLPPGILGLLSGYLLPIHRLCDPDELDSLLRSTESQGWRSFTSDPFLGLLDNVEPSEIVTLKSPRFSIIWSIAAVIERKRLAHLLGEMHRILQKTLHVYPCGESLTETNQNPGRRLHIHNPALLEQTKDAASTPIAAHGTERWLFVLGDQDYTVQEAKYGHTLWSNGISWKFRKVLLDKLHETLKAGRVPILVAPALVIESVQRHSPVADSMQLLVHCDYPQFQTLLMDAEYVFYWNAVSFSCIQRTLADKPWFTFDDGHVLRGMNADYASRIFNWFYRGDAPPRLDINTTITCESLQQATQQYLKSARRVRQALLASSEPQALLSALAPQNATLPEEGNSSDG